MQVNEVENRPGAGRSNQRRSARLWTGAAAAVVIVGLAGLSYGYRQSEAAEPAAAPAAPQVVVSKPLVRDLDVKLGFLGQFSAVDQVELRAQVGGTLTEIHFKDGDIVHKGDLLFVIDPVPYDIRLAQATAQLESAVARLDLGDRELKRAQDLKRSDAGSTQNVDQRSSEQRAAQAAVDAAKAQIRDAKFDLDHCRISAPFTGRIGTHLVSIGNLVAGSRAATSPTTLLATLVSTDPIYLNFDMSEADYLTYSHERAAHKRATAEKVEIAPGAGAEFETEGTLDFIDNVLDRSSGTLHARATVPNADFVLTPGEFARVRVIVSSPVPTLLVPDSSVLPDQSEHIVLTVTPDGTVAPKVVQVGDIRGGLRVIRGGLAATDKVIIEGIPYAAPGSKVAPQDGAIQFAAAQGQK